jgi:hypothetical protein
VSRFLIDAFAGQTGANLTARSPELGGPWEKVPAVNPDIVLSIANRARGNSNSLALYTVDGSPVSEDYDVSGRTIRQTGVGEWNVTLRASATARTYYAVGYTGSNWLIRRVVNNTATTLATFSAAWANDETKGWRVKIRGTNPVTIRLLDEMVGGNVIAEATDTNGSRIQTAGRVGLRINAGTNTLFETRGYHVGLLVAYAIPADPRPRAPRPADGPLAQRILAKAVAERAAERAAILAEAGTPPGWQATRGATTYTLTLPQGLTVRDGRLVIPEVTCVPPPPIPLDPPYVFTNPPVKAPDGTVREDVDEDGEPVIVPNDVENPLEALRQVVADCVLRGS